MCMNRDSERAVEKQKGMRRRRERGRRRRRERRERKGGGKKEEEEHAQSQVRGSQGRKV